MKWFIFVVELATIAFAVHAQVPTKPDLVGHVISPPGKSVKATAVLCYWQTKPGKQPSDMGDLPRHVQADERGNFKFESLDPSLLYHLPPNRSFSLYATMESLAGQGAVSRRKGQVHSDGSTSDFGDLNLDPAFRVEGRIRLSDGKPIPSDSRVRLTRTTMVGLQDGLSFAVGEDGSFHFAGVPAERVTLYLRIPGYQLTPQDALLKSGSATNLTVITNVTGFLIEMKPATSFEP